MADNTLIRLNKYLSGAGVCSRRGADELIESGRVLVDKAVATTGMKIDPEKNIVSVDGKEIGCCEKKVVIAYNKPEGIICSLKSQGLDDKCIADVIDCDFRVYPVGRLDKDSTGLVILTNDGDLADFIMRAGDSHEKEYLVRTDKEIDSEFVDKMRGGVRITLLKNGTEYEYTTKKCHVQKTGFDSFKIVLTEGKNRQIRKMCESLGYNVKSLHRNRIMGLDIGDLESGQWRELSMEEIDKLK